MVILDAYKQKKYGKKSKRIRKKMSNLKIKKSGYTPIRRAFTVFGPLLISLQLHQCPN